MLELVDIRYGVDGVPILEGIDARFVPGTLTVIIGPNGSGKSTMLRIASQELAPTSGEVRYDGRSVGMADRAGLARVRAALSQSIELAFPLSVEEVVMMGRYPHFALKPSAADIAIRDAAMERAGVESFRDRNYLTLSGGEKQMTQFARVLAQIWERPASADARYFLLDEPTSFLDINHGHHLLATLRAIAAEGVAVIAVVHDVNLASQYADTIIALHRGRVVAEGAPADVIAPELFMTLYGMRGRIVGGDLDFPLVVF
jgi:iron complex transport system ATP-binding protein